MTLYLPVMVLAGEWDIAEGDIAVDRSSDTEQTVSQGTRSENDSNPTIKGTSSEHCVIISAAQDTTATVTFQNLNIGVSNSGGSNNAGLMAVNTTGAGDVTINLDGENTVASGYYCAGIQKENTGNLTITGTDGTNTDSLSATGGAYGAGIGGGNQGAGSDITISGDATVNATGGAYGAGIGGGNRGDGLGITISGESTVSATGVIKGAGIGGGNQGAGSDITISGNATVTATGGEDGAGIGGGNQGAGSDITISGEATITATGGDMAAGIGGGQNGAGSDIAIGGNSTVIAVGGDSGAGIGGGFRGSASDISISGSADVSAAGGAAYSDNYDNYGVGAAIGSGGTGSEDGEDFPLDTATAELYDTGSIKTYAPGSTAEQITAGTVDPVDETPGTVPDPNTEQEPDPDPNPQVRPAVVALSDSEAVSEGNAQTAPAGEAFSLSAVLDAKIETFLEQLAALLASGRPDLIRALMKAGFSVDLGDFTMLNAKTCALLAQVADAGIPVKADYTYGGVNYRTTIPAGEGATVNALAADGVCTIEELMSAFETQIR